MDPALFERLLYEEEGNALDFKRDQYPFSKQLTMRKRNSSKIFSVWRIPFDTPTRTSIGVEEVRGGRSNVVGITEHLADHSLQ